MQAIERAISHGDWLRRSPARFGGAGAHKEWLHFCVYGAGVDVLANFSLVDDVRLGHGRPGELARTTLLVRETRWMGEIARHAGRDVEIEGGGIALRIGPSSVHFADGRYHLRAAFARRPVAIDLELEPVTMPSIVNNVQVGDGPSLNWLVVPRLVARGRVTIGDRVHEIDGALAYHDHNWGRFGWGRDFAWEWGYGLPDDPRVPWSLVFVRLSNRAHTRSMMQGAFLWRGPREHRVFRDRDLEVRHVSLLRAERVCKIPPVMALIHPELATAVPRQLVFSAASEGDSLTAEFTSRDVAQVIIPNDRDVGVTIINEVSGDLAVEGVVRGEAVSIHGRAIFEFLGA